MLHYIESYFIELFELTNEMAPYLLLGFLFAGILHVFIRQNRIVRYMGKRNFKASLNSALIGIPLPLCSCGVIPTGISLYKNGASKGSSVSFLVSTPQTGVDSVLVTWSLLGLPFALIRPVIALLTGVFGGALTNIFTKKEEQERPHVIIQTKEKGSKLMRMLKYAFVDFLQDISKWLIIGLVLAAFMAVLIPDGFFTQYLDNPLLSMLIVLLASVPLYVCATGSVPIAAVLLMKGLSPGAALVFLMAGPATNAATMTVIGNSMGRKTLISYMASIIGGAVIFGLMIDYLFPEGFFITSALAGGHMHEHEILPTWLKIGSTVALVLLIINGYLRKYFFKPSKTPVSVKTNIIEVSGMTCNHCKNSVESNLQKIEGIESVTADITKEQVEINGENIDFDKIKETINALGYEYKGEKK
jgi:uncharacterized membrane protein YraQ (UPF0718 family)/copper chaperone CopZ